MTIAHLYVKLSANAAVFHQEMERAARRAQQTGRVFVKIGRDISTAISLPLIAGAFGAFHALLQESTRHFGPLFQAVESLKAAAHGLFLAIGHELAPTFNQIIGLLRGGIAILRDWIDAFHRLPAGVRQAVIFTLAFLAALGPTVFVVGKLITAIGALIKILPLLVSGTGLAVVAVAALTAAAIYAATHWQETQLRLVLVWTAIKATFFDGIRAILGGIGALVQGAAAVSSAYAEMPGLVGAAFRLMAAAAVPAARAIEELKASFDAFADRSLAKSAAQILELERGLKRIGTTIHDSSAFALAAAEAFAAYNLAIRTLNANAAVFGASFNRNAASAAALKAEIDALVASALKFGVALFAVTGAGGDPLTVMAQRYQQLTDSASMYDLALNLLGPTLADHARLLEMAARMGINLDTITKHQLAQLSAYAEGLAAINSEIKTAFVDAWSALGEQLGGILAGITNGFRGFGNKLAGVLGTMLVTIGQAMIAMGIAGDAIKRFITNPFTAIAAGVALIALGSALSAAAAGAVTAGGNTLAGGGGGGAAASTTSAAPIEDQGTLILRLDSNFRRLNPEFVDIIAQALEEAKSRRVIIEESD